MLELCASTQPLLHHIHLARQEPQSCSHSSTVSNPLPGLSNSKGTKARRSGLSGSVWQRQPSWHLALRGGTCSGDRLYSTKHIELQNISLAENHLHGLACKNTRTSSPDPRFPSHILAEPPHPIPYPSPRVLLDTTPFIARASTRPLATKSSLLLRNWRHQ